MKKRLICTGLVVILIVGVIICSGFASSLSITEDFENGIDAFNWRQLYNNANCDMMSEDSGNHYIKLTYNGNENRDRKYFDIVSAETSNSMQNTIIQAQYDVKYSEIETERNGEIQFKYRTGPGSSETNVVARLTQNYGYFQLEAGENLGFQRIKDLDGQYLPIEIDKWYTVKMVVNLSEHWQSIYIFDRDTEKLLGKTEYIPTITTLSMINMITFKSSTELCLDNVKIGEGTCVDSYISGKPYVKNGEFARYSFLGKDNEGDVTSLPQGTTTWSIVEGKKGVSINSSTGKFTVSSSANPGVIVIKATHIVEDKTFESTFPVNITK